jgi:XTP/dITP diphosphohydrolase
LEILVATRSVGKMREIRRILADVPGLVVRDLDEAGIAYDPREEGLEPHETFEENATSKARYFFERSGLPTVADDSGIEIDALSGAPGVRSKRFAPDAGVVVEGGELGGLSLDEANNRHMLDRLRGVAPADRSARYVCVAVLVRDGAEPLIVRGEAEGYVVDTPAGSGGFGYDPFIFDEELGMTFAQMSGPEKDQRSHRGRAFRQLARELSSHGS